MEEKKVMLSGIQPSGDLHLGNYLGAIKNWGARAEEFDCYYFMADMHTITVRQEPAKLRRRTLEQRARISPAVWTRRRTPVRPVPRPRPCGAGLGAQLLHHVRRAVPHDPVQG